MVSGRRAFSALHIYSMAQCVCVRELFVFGERERAGQFMKLALNYQCVCVCVCAQDCGYMACVLYSLSVLIYPSLSLTIWPLLQPLVERYSHGTAYH